MAKDNVIFLLKTQYNNFIGSSTKLPPKDGSTHNNITPIQILSYFRSRLILLFFFFHYKDLSSTCLLYSKPTKCRIMSTKCFSLYDAGATYSSHVRKKCEVMAVIKNGKKANLTAKRKERIELPKYGDSQSKDFSISKFFSHPSGIKTLLNTSALQSFEPIDLNTYRCTLPKIQLLNSDVVPVIDLRVAPSSIDCTVEMLSCKFVGSEVIQRQNEVFSASMINHITWEESCSEPCLQVDVTINITLEVYTKPFSLLPVSVVEKPGNMVMQSLIDRLVPLLGEQIIKDYCAWIEECSQCT